MNANHISASSLEGYVMCTLADAECAIIEAHVASCEACAARLQREARLELAFAAVATRAPRKSPIAARMTMIGAGLGASLAVAAAMLFWVLPHGETERAQQVEDPVITDTSGDASTVTASLDLQADGSRVGVRD